MTRHVIVGAGEVGTALARVLPGAMLTDHTEVAGDTADALHVAFPWSGEFVAEVERYQHLFLPHLVIVHSTVPVGTCDPREWVHAPVRGRHPDLVAGLKTFVMHVGGLHAQRAARLLTAAGITTHIHARAAETEAGKVWELVQFGVNVAVEKAIHAWCVERGLDPTEVYAWFAETYNAGYTQLGQGHLARPVIEHTDGPIGGHCVVPGARLLDQDTDPLIFAPPPPTNLLVDLIERYAP